MEPSHYYSKSWTTPVPKLKKKFNSREGSYYKNSNKKESSHLTIEKQNYQILKTSQKISHRNFQQWDKIPYKFKKKNLPESEILKLDEEDDELKLFLEAEREAQQTWMKKVIKN